MTGRFPSGSNRRWPLSDRLAARECWTMKVTNKRKNATTEMRMLRGILGVSRRDQMRNEEIRHIHVSPIDEVKCAVAVFVGLGVSRDEMQTTSPAE